MSHREASESQQDASKPLAKPHMSAICTAKAGSVIKPASLVGEI